MTWVSLPSALQTCTCSRRTVLSRPLTLSADSWSTLFVRINLAGEADKGSRCGKDRIDSFENFFEKFPERIFLENYLDTTTEQDFSSSGSDRRYAATFFADFFWAFVGVAFPIISPPAAVKRFLSFCIVTPPLLFQQIGNP